MGSFLSLVLLARMCMFLENISIKLLVLSPSIELNKLAINCAKAKSKSSSLRSLRQR